MPDRLVFSQSQTSTMVQPFPVLWNLCLFCEIYLCFVKYILRFWNIYYDWPSGPLYITLVLWALSIFSYSQVTVGHFCWVFWSKAKLFGTTIGRGSAHFSRILSLHTWLQSACRSHNIGFIDNFNLFWEHLSFFKTDGIHPNKLGRCIVVTVTLKK